MNSTRWRIVNCVSSATEYRLPAATSGWSTTRSTEWAAFRVKTRLSSLIPPSAITNVLRPSRTRRITDQSYGPGDRGP